MHSIDVLQEQKRDLRKKIQDKRDAIPFPVRKAKDALIAASLREQKEYRDATTVLVFASFRSEVQTDSIIKNALDRGKRVILPKVDAEQKELRLYEIKALEELISGYRGIPEPAGNSEGEVVIGDIDLILIPGVAFDEKGGRLGYGGGYYDRLIGGLEHKPPLIAIAYSEQMVNAVPRTVTDILIDRIITEEKVIEASQ